MSTQIISEKDQETLTRARLAELIQDKYGDALKLTRQCYMNVVDSFFEEICGTLVRGESVKISSFGSFLIRHKKERMGRNPKTGEDATISERRVVTFRASQNLKSRVNSLRRDSKQSKR
jgi:integration host factor subunit alpha